MPQTPTSDTKLRPILAPAQSWGKAARIAAVILATLISIGLALAFKAGKHWNFIVSDSLWYQLLASGNLHVVPQPFASRQLGAAIVHMMILLFHWPLNQAFIVEGSISFALLLIAVYALFVRSNAPRWLLAALAVVPFWAEIFHGLILPDLWYAFLLVGFLWLLVRNQLLLAAAMMFPLMVSRESTVLTLICFLIAAWKPLRWSGRLFALVAAVAGTLLVQHLTAGNPGNIEHLPQFVYMFLKVPWNFLTNIVGVLPWSNVYPLFCGNTPAWQHPFNLGPVRAIGVCGYSPLRPTLCLVSALSTFGLLPLLTAFLLLRSRRTTHPATSRTVLLRFCVIYGGISFVLAPMLGVVTTRLFGYSWPLLLVALPLFFEDLQSPPLAPRRPAAALLFLALHLATCAVTFVGWGVAIAPYVFGLNAAGFLLLFWWWGPVQATPATSLGNSLEKPVSTPL